MEEFKEKDTKSLNVRKCILEASKETLLKQNSKMRELVGRVTFSLTKGTSKLHQTVQLPVPVIDPVPKVKIV